MPWSGSALGLTDLGFVAGRSKPIVLAVMGRTMRARPHYSGPAIFYSGAVTDRTTSCDSPAPARLPDGRTSQVRCAGNPVHFRPPSPRIHPAPLHESRDCSTWRSSTTAIIARTM